MTTDDYLDDPAKLALTPEMRAAFAHRLETDRRGANTIPAGDLYRAARRLWQINVIDAPDHIQIQVDMLADMLAALDTTPEGTDPS